MFRAWDRPAKAVQVLIVYYDQNGAVQQMADAVASGVDIVPEAEPVLRRIDEVEADDLLHADAIILGTPVSWAGLPGAVRDFLNDWWWKFDLYPERKLADKLAACFVTYRAEEEGYELAILSLISVLLGHHMVIVGGGKLYGARLRLGYGDLLEEDLAGAQDLGARVASLAAQLDRGRQ